MAASIPLKVSFLFLFLYLYRKFHIDKLKVYTIYNYLCDILKSSLKFLKQEIFKNDISILFKITP